LSILPTTFQKIQYRPVKFIAIFLLRPLTRFCYDAGNLSRIHPNRRIMGSERSIFKKAIFLLAIMLLSSLFLMAVTPSLAATYVVSLTGSDGGSGSSADPWRTLQHAADSVAAGDTVQIGSGTYAGFRAVSGGTEGQPITFMPEEGAAVLVNSVSTDGRKGSIIEIEGYDWWILAGLEVADAPANAGIDIRVADHVTIRNCHCHHNQKWGIFTAFAEHFTAEYNECNDQTEEHGIYHSNSGDNAIIRYNVCHHNTGCGIQINADPSMGGDGISSANVIFSNILYENGSAGGAAINLASVRDSLIANNLIYNNHAGGIAAWDDGQGNQWGSKNNLYYNNTVHMPSNGRWAVNLKNGSIDSRVYNNILIHENLARGGIEIDTSSLSGFSSNHNILARISLDETTLSLSKWQSTYFQDVQSFDETAVQTFVSPGSDYHLLSSARAKDSGTTLPEVPTDLDGNSRPQGDAYDMGAYEVISNTVCSECSGDTVVLTGGTFSNTCECVGTTSITISGKVTVQAGATITFKAPLVIIRSGFHVEAGASVRVQK
jgi:hypothetical protein